MFYFRVLLKTKGFFQISRKNIFSPYSPKITKTTKNDHALKKIGTVHNLKGPAGSATASPLKTLKKTPAHFLQGTPSRPWKSFTFSRKPRRSPTLPSIFKNMSGAEAEEKRRRSQTSLQKLKSWGQVLQCNILLQLACKADFEPQTLNPRKARAEVKRRESGAGPSHP